jgi:hypothetical protein
MTLSIGFSPERCESVEGRIAGDFAMAIVIGPNLHKFSVLSYGI